MNAIYVSPYSPEVGQSGKIKCLLIAYSLGSVFVKNSQNWLMLVKSYSRPELFSLQVIMHTSRVDQKTAHQTHSHISVKSNRFSEFFHSKILLSSSKFAVKWLLWIQPHLVYVATLSCEVMGSINCHV